MMYDLSNVVKAGLGFLGGLVALFISGIILKILYLAFMLGWNLV
jgi:hypothetical protein